MPVLFEQRGHVAIIRLSRPKARNAWDEDYNEGLIDLCAKMEANRDIRCVILTGDEEGGAFSAGANLKDENTHATHSASQFVEDLPKARKFVSNILSEFSKPIIAAVNGYAIGIGCISSISCDLIVASDRAEWRMPQVRLGILPAHAGVVRLARWVGQGNAMRLAMGFTLGAAEAHRIGLVQWLVPHETLMNKSMEIAESIASMPPLATRLLKESVNRGMDTPNIGDAALADVYRFMILQQTEDAHEAHSAWRQNRDPVFNGR